MALMGHDEELCKCPPFSPQSIQFMLQRKLTASSNTTPEDHLYTKRLHVILAVSLVQLSSFREHRKTDRQLWAEYQQSHNYAHVGLQKVFGKIQTIEYFI